MAHTIIQLILCLVTVPINFISFCKVVSYRCSYMYHFLVLNVQFSKHWGTFFSVFIIFPKFGNSFMTHFNLVLISYTFKVFWVVFLSYAKIQFFQGNHRDCEIVPFFRILDMPPNFKRMEAGIWSLSGLCRLCIQSSFDLSCCTLKFSFFPKKSPRCSHLQLLLTSNQTSRKRKQHYCKKLKQ